MKKKKKIKSMDNFINTKIGKLLVLDETRINEKTGVLEYKCLCDCGGYRYCAPCYIRKKIYKSCGNCLREKFDIKNYIGKKFGKLTILESYMYVKVKHGTRLMVLCQCDCMNNPVYVYMGNIKNSTTTSCGCAHDVSTIKTPKDFIGTKFNRWSICDQELPQYLNSNTILKCECECGTKRDVIYHTLVNGSSKSCGCLKSELSIKRLTKHGKSKTPEWSSWNDIIQRCYNKKNSSYKNYGHRGITVCNSWLDSGTGFNNFLEDLGHRPSSMYSLERKNPNGNYEKDNCMWQTRSKQNLNKRKSSNSKTKYKGVWFRPELSINSRYQAKIKKKILGYFPTAEDAARAYDKAFKEIYLEAAPYSTNEGLGLFKNSKPSHTYIKRIVFRPEYEYLKRGIHI